MHPVRDVVRVKAHSHLDTPKVLFRLRLCSNAILDRS